MNKTTIALALEGTPQIPYALANFDVLPDAAHVREPVVKALFGVSHATVWRWVKRGRLPAPRKLSARVSGWNVGDLRKSLAMDAGEVEQGGA